MNLIDNVKTTATSLLAKPTIDNMHPDEEHVASVVIAEGDQTQTPPQTYYPGSSFSSFIRNKYTAAAGTSYNRTYFTNANGDMYYCKNNADNFDRKGGPQNTDFIPRQQKYVEECMVKPMMEFRTNEEIIKQYSDSYPGYQFRPSQHGIIGYGPNGEYGLLNEQGEFTNLRLPS